ncbi:MAG TPA: 2,3-bisphosphoglycerate-independent phosphoglycerate mutase [Oculatellaceae cyanobacterium]
MPPVTLLILDGWGHSHEKRGNAILLAKTPNYDDMLNRYPNSLVEASGTCVGLPPGLMGNSEVGHLTIGAGRTVVQKLTLISDTIADGSFFTNPVLLKAFEQAKKPGAALHITGLVSDGCVHSSPDHLQGLIAFAKREKLNEVIVHPILDGRDTPPRSALRFMRELQEHLEGVGKVGVVCGRYYAMDRDSRWERIEKFWRAIVLGEGKRANSAMEAVQNAYDNNLNDEFVTPYVVTQRGIKDGDAVICFNFRPDRVRQISRALTQADFAGFERPVTPSIYYACMTEYDQSLKLPVAFDPSVLPSQDIEMTLPECVACHHKKQFHTAETEKYAHVTYFLNGGREAACHDEERLLIPSLKVATYDLAPGMQTEKICDAAIEAIHSDQYPLIVLNFANPDMVGHTGILEKAIDAVQSVDVAFGRLIEATSKAQGSLLITADHGNCEQMIDLKTGEPHTAHTTNPVPAIVADFQAGDRLGLRNGTKMRKGTLADIAPTALELMGLDKPEQMSGTSLLSRS